MNETSQLFLMSIFRFEEFAHRSNHCLATGVVQRGSVSKRDVVQIVSLGNAIIETKVVEVEIGKSVNHDGSTTNTTLILQDPVDSDEFSWGWIISPPNAVKCHSSFLADVTLLTPEQGGRNAPITFVIGYAPALRYEVILKIHSLTFLCSPQHPKPDTIDYMELEPGDTASLLFPVGRYIPLDIGYRFQLQEGGKVVATGIVTEVY